MPFRPTFLSALALLAALALGACRETAPRVTGLRLLPQWSGFDVDQLELIVLGPFDDRLVDGERRPQVPQTLAPGEDILVLLPDALANTSVRVLLNGLWGGKRVGSGESTALVREHAVVPVEVQLDRGKTPLPPLPPPRDAAPIVLPDPGVTGKPNGAACAAASECRSNLCVDGFCCDSACADTCQACNVPGKQGTCSFVPLGVKHGRCAAEPAETCGLDGTCDGAGACRKHPSGTRCAPGACEDGSIVGVGLCDGAGACVKGQTLLCAPFNCDRSGNVPRCHTRCSTNTDCVAGRNCVGASCGEKVEGAQCEVGTECATGICAQGVCCDKPCDAKCVSCNQVGAMGRCRPVPAGAPDPKDACKDQGAMSCGTTGACDGAGDCALYAAGTMCRPATCSGVSVLQTAGRCDGAGRCNQGSSLTCSPFACSNGACNATCTADSHCAPNRTCDVARRSCGKKGLGQPCSEAVQCESGHCVDGVCCNEACAGPCRSCTAGRVPGTCTVTPVGVADPRRQCQDQGAASCGNDGTCNGAGGCRKYAAGTVCGAASCSTTTNMRTLPPTCDGGGRCQPGPSVSCAPYRCNGAVCFSACATDAQCADGGVCRNGSCATLKALGTRCAAGTECVSGHCTEGVCCEAASCGRCRSCNVAGAAGVCRGVPAGTPDARCPTDAASTCKNDGKCDGAGNCRLYPSGTECAPAGCPSVSVRSRPSTCDGAGQCVARGNEDCAPYRCSGGVCGSSCQSNSDCCCRTRCRNNACE